MSAILRAPITGHHYTMSAMKHRCGDRSWIGHIWKVLEGNGSAVVIQNAFPGGHYTFGGEPHVVAVHEFDWTPADELADAMRAAQVDTHPKGVDANAAPAPLSSAVAEGHAPNSIPENPPHD